VQSDMLFLEGREKEHVEVIIGIDEDSGVGLDAGGWVRSFRGVERKDAEREKQDQRGKREAAHFGLGKAALDEPPLVT
jgi:hypothetical protein